MAKILDAIAGILLIGTMGIYSGIRLTEIYTGDIAVMETGCIFVIVVSGGFLLTRLLRKNGD